MKKIHFAFLCFVSCIINVHAQYVFNSCNTRPVFGDSLTGILYQYDSTGVTPENAGTNISWNYSSIVNTYTYSINNNYYDPATTIGFYKFPNANLTDLGSGMVYSYYNYSADSVTFLGDYHDSVSFHSSWDPEVLMMCPLSFGNSYTDRFSRYNFGQCPYHHTYTKRKITYDGNGTISLPHNSYSTARLKIVERTLDTSFCQANQLVLSHTLDSTYLWIDTQSNQQIFSVHYFIDTANHYSNKIIQEYYYSHFPVTFTSVQSFADAQSDFLVYPNPTTGEFTVYSLQSSVGCEIKVTNLVGETISKKTLNSKQETINLSGARGIYFLQIKTPYGTAMKKIVKE